MPPDFSDFLSPIPPSHSGLLDGSPVFCLRAFILAVLLPQHSWCTYPLDFLSFKSLLKSHLCNQNHPGHPQSAPSPPSAPLILFYTLSVCYITYLLNKLWNYYVDSLSLLEYKTCIGKEFFLLYSVMNPKHLEQRPWVLT